jgi:hypothetical protein
MMRFAALTTSYGSAQDAVSRRRTASIATPGFSRAVAMRFAALTTSYDLRRMR